MYRPPSRAPKGDWANHLHAERRRRDLSQNQAFELIRERLHWSPRSRASYMALDMGDRQPRPEEAEALASEFGWPPEGVSAPAQATETPADLIAALLRQAESIAASAAATDRQAAAINALVNEMREAREREQDVASAIFAALAVLRPGPTTGGASGSTALVSRIG